jgi:hypothetical protein
MTEEKLVKWEPKKFDGSDLLPVEYLSAPTETDQHGQALVGRQNVEKEDLILPTIRLLQGMSPAVTEGTEGAKPGLFIHSATQQVFQPPLRLIVVAHYKSNALYPRADNIAHRGLERCISRDAVQGDRYGLCEECRKCLDWGENGQPPLGSQSHCFTVLTEHGPAVMRFNRTSFKAARQFITTWNMSRKNLWAHPTVVRVTKNEKQLPGGQKTTYFTMSPLWQTTELVPPSLQTAALAYHEMVMAAHQSGRFGSDDEDIDQ